ncbi:hypothetical protein BDV38DRAFT_252253 [Aspergillus pseudotamarii]|uniref:Uncharacterized protein n=1 Tax=Aspergillus pseudotamarii TaxID=132259 RepID=A0A5N6SLI8_ASPPS|nr:uncharacterized protein BDV38DRAFT_252253 [Aspergillus pseudotamarii]KAE8135415.1 hypothetical protein BDV38DRAFT_252253 [Aspergillus pseudotamarii]
MDGTGVGILIELLTECCYSYREPLHPPFVAKTETKLRSSLVKLPGVPYKKELFAGCYGPAESSDDDSSALLDENWTETYLSPKTASSFSKILPTYSIDCM